MPLSCRKIQAQFRAHGRLFLATLSFDPSGYPMHAGIGGTYRIRRPVG